QGADHVAGEVLAAGPGGAQDQAHDRLPGHPRGELLAPVVVVHARARERALGEGGAGFEATRSDVRLDSRVPAEGVDEGQAGLRVGIAPAERVTHAPPGAAGDEEVAL